MKYNVGDKVWIADCTTTEKCVVCPDCFGKRFLTVIKGDDSQVTIDCAGCALGYEPPRGYVTYWSWSSFVREVVIGGIDIKINREVEYNIDVTECSWRTVKEHDIFSTEEEARKRAELLANEHNQEELNKINQKEKHNRTWSWNAHYHQRCIKNAQREIEYHTTKLNAAKKHVKEEKCQS